MKAKVRGSAWRYDGVRLAPSTVSDLETAWKKGSRGDVNSPWSSLERSVGRLTSVERARGGRTVVAAL